MDFDSEEDHKESLVDPFEHKESGPHVYDSAMISNACSEQLEYHAELETSFKIEDDYQQVILSIGSKRSKMLDPSSPLDHEVSPLKKQKTLL